MQAAATDPAYVPGLMPPRPGPQADGAPDAGGETPGPAEVSAGAAAAGEVPETGVREAPAPQDTTSRDAAPQDAAPQDAAPLDTAEPAPEDGTGEHGPSAAADAGGEDGSDPAFEVADRRSVIIANRAGVVLRLDDQEAEFDWNEIGAVEFQTSKYGRRLTIFVHLPNRHTYQADVTASGRDELRQWSARLDTVLDTYFEE